MLKAHRCSAFGGCWVLPIVTRLGFVAFAPFGGRHQRAVLAVRREHPMKAGEIHSGLRHQGGQPGKEIQWLEDDVRGPVPVRRLQLVANVAVRRERQALFRHFSIPTTFFQEESDLVRCNAPNPSDECCGPTKEQYKGSARAAIGRNASAGSRAPSRIAVGECNRLQFVCFGRPPAYRERQFRASRYATHASASEIAVTNT